MRADSDSPLTRLVKHETPRLAPEADLEEVARVMADYNLTSVPVVDERTQMIGVITVDDVLEAMLPRGWRRRFGLLGDS
jgi:Mg/Co/Ni transporter MgtE